MLELFIKMFLAHLLGDFVFQPNKWLQEKEKDSWASKFMYFHLLVHLGLTLLFTGFKSEYWALYFLVFLSHFFIDVWRINLKEKFSERVLFVSDQFLHLGSLLILSFYFSDTNPIAFESVFTTKVVLGITCIVFLTHTSSIILKVLLSKWSNQLLNEGKYQGLSEAGKYIGMLERLFIFSFVVLGKWEGVGFLLTAKSIFRFGDLTSNKDHKFTEYILIGTLLSFGVSICTGLIFRWLLGIV